MTTELVQYLSSGCALSVLFFHASTGAFIFRICVKRVGLFVYVITHCCSLCVCEAVAGHRFMCLCGVGPCLSTGTLLPLSSVIYNGRVCVLVRVCMSPRSDHYARAASSLLLFKRSSALNYTSPCPTIVPERAAVRLPVALRESEQNHLFCLRSLRRYRALAGCG